MSWIFSKRCENSLNNGKLKVSIKIPIRTRIWKAFQDFDESYWISDDFGSRETSTIGILPDRIEAELGLSELLAFPKESGHPKPGNIEDFVMRGTYPPYLFDTIEIFYSVLDKNKSTFQVRINEIMEESCLSWRMANGRVFPVDSFYIEESIINKAYELINEVDFQGALLEFENSRIDFTSGDYEGAINNANQAVESVIKEILGIQKAKPGALYRKLRESGIIPEYHKGFLQAFEEHIVRCVANARNSEPGVAHGRGKSNDSIAPEIAELCIGLSAVLINYLIKMHMKQLYSNDELDF